MLQLILGRSGTGKTHYIRNKLCSLAGNTDKKLMLIVPDQYSFDTERAILETAGPRRSSLINVWSFSRLADEVFRLYGGITEKRLDDCGKSIIMSMAIKACGDNLSMYGNATDRLTPLMLSAADEFKTCCITPEDLSKIAVGAQGSLKQKLADISLVYSAYEAMINNIYIDSSDILTRVGGILKESNFFKDSIVAFDGFDDFNRQKLNIIQSALKQADEVYMTLCGESAHNSDGSSIFSPVHSTAAAITALARENNIEVKNPMLLKEPHRYKNPELVHGEAYVFGGASLPYQSEPENISVFEGRTVYDEAEFAASEIRRLIIEKNYRYGDFSIVCRNPQKYYTVIGSVLEKWNIPCYFSEPKRIDGEPLMRLVLSAFSVIRSSFRTDDVLTMLKTGLCPVNSMELSEVENYVFMWKITGKQWKSEFFRHPKGFGYDMDEESQAQLAVLEELRVRIITPLIHLSDSIKDTSGRGISESVYNFLADYSVQEKITQNAELFTKINREDKAVSSVKMWQRLMDVLDRFVTIFGDSPINWEDYYRYLSDVLSTEEIQEIPMYHDTVIFGTADLIKQDSAKVSFVIGAVQGELPLIPKEGGVFTDAERKNLKELELPLEDYLEEKIKLERFVAYTAAAAPSEKLYVTYHLSHGGDDFAPGELVDRILSTFPLLKVKKNIPIESYAGTYASAFSAYAASFASADSLHMTLKELFENNSEYSSKIAALEKINENTLAEIKNKKISAAMFRDNYISASQIDVFHHCKFQYFCKYGLNARERKPAEINVMEYGTLMHFLFEKIFSGDFSVYYGKTQELIKRVTQLIRDYADEKMGGYGNMSGRDKYRFKRMADTAVTLILHVIEELSFSKFKPEYFELALSEHTDFPPLKIKTPDGSYVSVGGVIDRVDLYDSPKGKYVRIVDYKTGRKEFKLFDVLYGLNLQMLIYLAALAQNKSLIPAGVLYMPSSMPSVSAEKAMDSGEVAAARDKKMCMNGIVLEDNDIIEAMEAGAEGRFIPVGIKPNGKYTKPENVISQEHLNVVFSHIKNLVATMADSLVNGKIGAEPLMLNNNSCGWCPYGSVCLSQRDDRMVEGLKIKKEQVIELMGGKAQ